MNLDSMFEPRKNLCPDGQHLWVPVYRVRWQKWWWRREYYFECWDCDAVRERAAVA